MTASNLALHAVRAHFGQESSRRGLSKSERSVLRLVKAAFTTANKSYTLRVKR